MTSPQLENGYTKIANELFDAIISFDFSKRELNVILAIARKTYGFNKKKDDISASQLSTMCSIPRPHVTTVLGDLERMNVITREPGRFATVIGINKRHGEWVERKSLKKKPKNAAIERDQAGLNHYTYMLTEKNTGNFYIGVRSCKCLPEQDRYKGSGNWVSSVSKADLEKVILGKYSTRVEAETAEVVLIKAFSADERLKNKWAYSSTTRCTETVQGHVQKQYRDMYRNSTGTCTETVQGHVQKQDTQKTTPKDNSKRQLQKTVPAGSATPADGQKKSGVKKSKTADTWSAYCAAYQMRYNVEPVRNKTVNSQLAQFVNRVPVNEAPSIAAFYVSHNSSYYVRRMHPVGGLLADAEKLRTEWVTRQQVTATQARQADSMQANATVAARARALSRGMHGGNVDE